MKRVEVGFVTAQSLTRIWNGMSPFRMPKLRGSHGTGGCFLKIDTITFIPREEVRNTSPKLSSLSHVGTRIQIENIPHDMLNSKMGGNDCHWKHQLGFRCHKHRMISIGIDQRSKEQKVASYDRREFPLNFFETMGRWGLETLQGSHWVVKGVIAEKAVKHRRLGCFQLWHPSWSSAKAMKCHLQNSNKIMQLIVWQTRTQIPTWNHIDQSNVTRQIIDSHFLGVAGSTTGSHQEPLAKYVNVSCIRETVVGTIRDQSS